MAKLSDYVEIMENNMECVVLKVKPDSRLGLISLGCFNGNEEMIRLTKGMNNHTCTLFYQDGRVFSWHWGSKGYTIVSDSTEKSGKMIQSCLEDDFEICIDGCEDAIRNTLHIKTIRDSHGMRQQYSLVCVGQDAVYIHKGGKYVKCVTSLEDAKEYVYYRLNVESEILKQTTPSRKSIIITGTRKED